MHVKSITLKIYERILAEAKKNGNAEKLKPTKKKLNKLKEEVEAPDDAILGNYAFAPMRAPWDKGIPDETNTDIEDDLAQGLIQHFVGDIPMSAELGQALKTSLENGWYKKFLAEPEQTIVYRGIRVSEEWMIENIGENWKKQFAKAKGQLKINMVLSPKTGSIVTSWSNDIAMARLFADRTDQGVICCAAIKDNPNSFIDAANGLYKIPHFSKWRNEKEVLGIGAIKVNKVILV